MATKHINLRKLIPGMGLHDKLQLLFKNHRLKYEDSDNLILTPHEEDQIENSLIKEKDKKTIESAFELYELFRWGMIDVEIRFNALCAAEREFTLITLLAHLNYKSYIRIEEMKELIDEDANMNLITKLEGYQVHIPDFVNLLDPSETKHPIWSTTVMNRQPGLLIQRKLKKLVLETLQAKQAIYMIDYIHSKIGLTFFGEEDVNLFEVTKGIANEITNLKEDCTILSLYDTLIETNRLRTKDYAEPLVLQFLIDPNKALKLSKDHRSRMEEIVDKQLTYPHL